MEATKGEQPSSTIDPFEVARGLVKDAIREHPLILFHTGRLFSRLPAHTRELLGNAGMPLARAKEFIEAVLAEARQECPGFKASVRDEVTALDFELAGSVEWTDVLRYVHGSEATSAGRILSPAAEELLNRTEAGEFDAFLSELKVRRRIRYFGWTRLEDLVAEIRLKQGIALLFEEADRTWNKRQHLVRFEVQERGLLESPPTGLNPVLPEPPGPRLTHRVFQGWFLRLLAEAPLAGSETINLWCLSTRAEFARCFRLEKLGADLETGFLTELMAPMRTRTEFQIGWNLSDRSPVWTVQVKPAVSWEKTKTELKAVLGRPTPEEEFRLSSEAAVLFEWVQAMGEAKLERGLTPEIEQAIEKKQLLLTSPWSKRNFRLFVTLLCEEISAKTPVVLKPVDWFREQGPFDREEVFTRLRVGSAGGVTKGAELSGR